VIRRTLSHPRTRSLVATGVAIVLGAGSVPGATIESLTTDGTAISSAAAFADFEVTLEFRTDDATASVVGRLASDDGTSLVVSRPSLPTTPGEVTTFRFDVDGVDTDEQPVPAGTYELRVTVTDGAGAVTGTIPGIVIDRSPPQIVRATELGPDGPYRNGDVIALEIVTSERPDSLWLATAAFDSDPDAPPPVVTEVAADTMSSRYTYTITYRISPDNEQPDGPSLPLEVSARDSLENLATTGQDLAFCLSNHPLVHLLASAADPSDEVEALFVSLVEADGSPVADDRTYTRGDTIRVRTVFQVARSSDDELAVLNYVADFSEVDSEFNPFGGQGADTPAPVVVDLPDSLSAGEGYAFVQTTSTYGISPLNLRPEGDYEVTITVREGPLGCSEAVALPVEVRLEDLGPPTPSFDPRATESVDRDAVTLTGTAPDARRVEIALLGESRGQEAVLDTLTGRFSATLSLERGWNRFVAIGFGPFNHPSPASEPIEVYRVGSTELDAPARFRPGDAITISSEEPLERIELEIWNLASERIWAEEAIAPGDLHEFVWPGRNTSGERVKTGPYVIHVTLHHPGRTTTADRAIVFTRK